MVDTKALTARLCELCERLFPEEWPGKYTGTQENFKEWVNEKTELTKNHMTNKEDALTAWVAKLEELNNA